MPKITIASVRDFFKKNQDIILPALCIFGYGLAIGLALNGIADQRGASQGASIQILAKNSSVTLDDVVVTGANAPALVLDD